MAGLRWSQNLKTLEDVIMNTDFPCSVKVEKSDIPNVRIGEIYRLDAYASQTRFMVSDAGSNEYSIPEKYPLHLTLSGKSGYYDLQDLSRNGLQDFPVTMTVGHQKNATELRKYGDPFRQLTFTEVEEIPYAIVSAVDQKGCINLHMSAMSSQWPVVVRVADPKSTRLCKGCADHLHDMKTRDMKSKVLEPDLFILRLESEETADRLRVVTFADKTSKSVNGVGANQPGGKNRGQADISREGSLSRPPVSILRSKSSQEAERRRGMKKSNSVPDFGAKHHSHGDRSSFTSDPGRVDKSSLGSSKHSGSSRHSGGSGHLSESSSGTPSLAEDAISEEPNHHDRNTGSNDYYQLRRDGRHSVPDTQDKHRRGAGLPRSASYEKCRSGGYGSQRSRDGTGKRTRSPPLPGSR